MNIYARIRKIEDSKEFKRLVDTVLGSELGHEYQSVKEWKDFGIDGYNKKQKIVYAFYCPAYPERKELKQYKTKIDSDIKKLSNAIRKNKLTLKIKEWIFVTPDDLPVDIIEFINQRAIGEGFRSGAAITAQVLAPLFMKYDKIHSDFPNITAGLQFDKIPSVDVRFAKNGPYKMLELFNDGTEDIKNVEVSIAENNGNERKMTNNFIFEFDNPAMGKVHSLFNLKKGERQYCQNIPVDGNFIFKITGIGVESGKTFVKDGFIPKIETWEYN